MPAYTDVYDEGYNKVKLFTITVKLIIVNIITAVRYRHIIVNYQYCIVKCWINNNYSNNTTTITIQLQAMVSLYCEMN